MNMVGTREGTRAPLAWVAGAALVLALAGCGSSSQPASVPSTSSKPSASPTAPSTATTMPDAAADKVTAQSLVLVQADLPAGWTGSAPSSDPQDTELSRKVAACAGASDPAKETADVSGLDFDKGHAEVSSEVALAPSRAAFEADLAALRSSKYETCVQSVFNTQLRADIAKQSPGVTLGDLTISRFATPTYGEVTVGFRLSATITGPTGSSIQLYIDEVGYGRGRSEVTLTFNDQGAPFDQVLERALVAKAAAKLKASAA
jgi:hypothetical protein